MNRGNLMASRRPSRSPHMGHAAPYAKLFPLGRRGSDNPVPALKDAIGRLTPVEMVTEQVADDLPQGYPPPASQFRHAASVPLKQFTSTGARMPSTLASSLRCQIVHPRPYPAAGASAMLRTHSG